jgi:hypothetical protein
MWLNEFEHFSDFPNALSEHNSIEELCTYLNDTVRQYCISEWLIQESQRQTYSSSYDAYKHGSPDEKSRWSLYRNLHPEKFSNELCKKDFREILQTKIQERIGKVFKNWIHTNQPWGSIKLIFIKPTWSHLKEIKNGSIEWVLRFKIIKKLRPRYIKDGDIKEYTLNFEIYVSHITWKISKTVKWDNSLVLPSSNRNYKIAIIAPQKTDIETEERDASIKRSREAYREQLMRVVRSWSFSKK